MAGSSTSSLPQTKKGIKSGVEIAKKTLRPTLKLRLAGPPPFYTPQPSLAARHQVAKLSASRGTHRRRYNCENTKGGDGKEREDRINRYLRLGLKCKRRLPPELYNFLELGVGLNISGQLQKEQIVFHSLETSRSLGWL